MIFAVGPWPSQRPFHPRVSARDAAAKMGKGPGRGRLSGPIAAYVGRERVADDLKLQGNGNADLNIG